jgi:hypothetical protein
MKKSDMNENFSRLSDLKNRSEKVTGEDGFCGFLRPMVILLLEKISKYEQARHPCSRFSFKSVRRLAPTI